MVFIQIALSALSIFSSDTATYSTNKKVELEQVEVTAPATRSEMQHINLISPTQLKSTSMGQDIPSMINLSTSVTTSSDAGNAVGYTGMRIRGNDLSSIRVSLNGVQMNEQESQDVYFVDIPDLLNALGKIEIVRGNGNLFSSASSGFGGSMHLTTQPNSITPHVELSSSYGSFNTYKENISIGTGLLNNHFSLEGFVSKIGSKGYIDRASSKLQSAYLQASYISQKISAQIIYIGGTEQTYQAWYGADAASLTSNRRYNPAGIMIQNDSIVGYYNNQTDNFSQHYLQTILSFSWNNWNFRPIFYYKKGSGYYENYNNNSILSQNYGTTLFSNIIQDTSNTIDQKWLTTEFAGTLLNINRTYNNLAINTTFDVNKYWGGHFGRILWAENATIKTPSSQEWYNSPAQKESAQAVINLRYKLSSQFRLYSELQYRYIHYSIDGTLEDLRQLNYAVNYHFLNPGLGLAYTPNKTFTFSTLFAISHREPTRTTFEEAGSEGIPTFETLYDGELGVKYTKNKLQASLNGFVMIYNNQLVQNGRLNSVGAYITTNVENSYRTGLEVEFSWHPTPTLSYTNNFTLSKNQIQNYTYYIDNYDTGNQDSHFLKNTTIAFSPSVIAAQSITYHPTKKVQLTWELKYVGSQYLDNTHNKNSSLNAYCTNNIHFLYTLKPKWSKQLELMGTVQNILNTQYISNGWAYEFQSQNTLNTQTGYFPQAGIHFLLGFKLYL